MNFRLFGVMLALCGLMAACDSAQRMGGSPVADATSTTTRVIPPGLEPPVQKNQDGRPEVTIDPCLDFDDEILVSAGLDPAYRQRGDLIAERTELACRYSGPEVVVRVGINNYTFEESQEDFENVIRERFVIGDRSAFSASSAVDPAHCSIVVHMREGTMYVGVDPRLEAKRAGKDGCTFAPDIARVFEAALPKDS